MKVQTSGSPWRVRTKNMCENVTVVVTQSGARGEMLVERLRTLGVVAEHEPFIETVPLPTHHIEASLRAIEGAVDGWIFTSAVAANVWCDVRGLMGKLEEPSPVCYCIGEPTAKALSSAGCVVRTFPGVHDGAELASAIVNYVNRPSAHFVFVRGNQSMRSVLTLRDCGHRVDELVVYDTRQASSDVLTIEQLTNSIWVFFSPSGVAAFLERCPPTMALEDRRTIRVIPFGHTTKHALEQAGFSVAAVPLSVTHDALIATILEITHA